MFALLATKPSTITIKHQNIPRSFFVYGTLRDDDDSGASWTANWIAGHSSAVNAKIYGYKMYKHPSCNYPFAIQTNDEMNNFMIGRLLTFDESLFAIKLKEADLIEGYDEENDASDGLGYQRVVVDAHILDEKIVVKEMVDDGGGNDQKMSAEQISDQELDAKVEDISIIENDDNINGKEKKESSTNVGNKNGGKIVQAHVYYRVPKSNEILLCDEMPEGNWMKRHLIKKGK